MELIKLHKSVILIDSDFLIKEMKMCYGFYSKRYPEKHFNKIDIMDILRLIALPSGLLQDGNSVDVIFFYNLDNSELPHMNAPSNLFEFSDFHSHPVVNTIQGCRFELHSFFADPEAEYEEQYYEEFDQILRQVGVMENVSKLCLIADNAWHNMTIEQLVRKTDLTIISFRSRNPEMDIDYNTPQFRYVNIEYTIAASMGLTLSEW